MNNELRTAALMMITITLAAGYMMGMLALGRYYKANDKPTADAAKIAYIENVLGEYYLTKATLPTHWKVDWHRLRVSHCVKNTAAIGQWTCDVYVQDQDGRHDEAEIQIIKRDGDWKAYQHNYPAQFW